MASKASTAAGGTARHAATDRHTPTGPRRAPLSVAQPDQLWVAEITQQRTGEAGWTWR
jgi:hypothetical protein